MGQENSKKSQDASTSQDSSIAIGKRWSYSNPSTKDKLLDEKSKPDTELLPQQNVKPGDHSMPRQKLHEEESKPEVELPSQQTVVKSVDDSVPTKKLHEEESNADHVDQLPHQQITVVVKPGDDSMRTKKEVANKGKSPQLQQNGDSVTHNSAVSSQPAPVNVQTIPDGHRPEKDANSLPKHESPEPIKHEEVVNKDEIPDHPKKKGYMQETANGTQNVEDSDQQQAAPNTSEKAAAGTKVEKRRAEWVDQQQNQPVDATIAKSVNNSFSDEYAVKTGVRWDY